MPQDDSSRAVVTSNKKTTEISATIDAAGYSIHASAYPKRKGDMQVLLEVMPLHEVQGISAKNPYASFEILRRDGQTGAEPVVVCYRTGKAGLHEEVGVIGQYIKEHCREVLQALDTSFDDSILSCVSEGVARAYEKAGTLW